MAAIYENMSGAIQIAASNFYKHRIEEFMDHIGGLLEFGPSITKISDIMKRIAPANFDDDGFIDEVRILTKTLCMARGKLRLGATKKADELLETFFTDLWGHRKGTLADASKDKFGNLAAL